MPHNFFSTGETRHATVTAEKQQWGKLNGLMKCFKKQRGRLLWTLVLCGAVANSSSRWFVMFSHFETLPDDSTSWGISFISPPHLVTSVKWLSVIMLLAADLQSFWAQSRDWKILLFPWEVLMNQAADSSKSKGGKNYFQVTVSCIDLLSLMSPLLRSKL